ncbi:MAG: DUF1616 domain-containing protein [archaeon]
MKKTIKIALGIILALSLISAAIAIFARMPFLQSLRIIFGSVYVLFLPGFIISFIFFPETKKFEERQGKKTKEKDNGNSIDWIERIALSFALSIAIVPLVVFYLNLIGIKINLLNSFITILGIIVISCGILRIRKRKIR